MSHFVTLVIVPQDCDHETEVARLLAPYDENLETAAHEVPCFCINSAAQGAGIAAASAQLGNMDVQRRVFQQRPDYPDLPKEHRIGAIRNALWDGKLPTNLSILTRFGIALQDSDGRNRHVEDLHADWTHWLDTVAQPEWDRVEKARESLWHEHIAPWLAAADVAEKAHLLYNQPSPECDACEGSGILISTENDDAKWDWWRIGGRWDGSMIDQPASSEHGFNLGEQHQQLKYNCLPVAQLVERGEATYYPFALVTPDGVWHEKATMGWFGMTSNESEESGWQERVRTLYARYAEGYVAVSCDLHI